MNELYVPQKLTEINSIS